MWETVSTPQAKSELIYAAQNHLHSAPRDSGVLMDRATGVPPVVGLLLTGTVCAFCMGWGNFSMLIAGCDILSRELSKEQPVFGELVSRLGLSRAL
jgi:hypothetical protein